MKNVRKVVVLLLTLMLMVPVIPGRGISAAVVDDVGIAPMSLNTDEIVLVLDIGSKGATSCYVSVIGATGTSKISGTLKLKKVTSSGNVTVKSWNLTTYSDVMNFTKTCFVFDKGTYKLVFNVTVTRKGVSETIKASCKAKYS